MQTKGFLSRTPPSFFGIYARRGVIVVVVCAVVGKIRMYAKSASLPSPASSSSNVHSPWHSPLLLLLLFGESLSDLNFVARRGGGRGGLHTGTH